MFVLFIFNSMTFSEWIKSVTIPISKLEDAINYNVWFDGSSIEDLPEFWVGYVPQARFEHFSMVPWESDEETGVARIICDVFLPDGKPFMGDPRQILRQQVERAKKLGYEYFVGPDWSFPFRWMRMENQPLIHTDTAGYFDYSSDRAGAIRQRWVMSWRKWELT